MQQMEEKLVKSDKNVKVERRGKPKIFLKKGGKASFYHGKNPDPLHTANRRRACSPVLNRDISNVL